MYFQTDTQQLYVWTGSAWIFVSDSRDTVHTMPAMNSGWSVGGAATYRFTTNGDTQVSFRNLSSNGTNTGDGTNIWSSGSLPGAYQPANTIRVAAYTDVQRQAGSLTESAALEFASDGSVRCYGVSGNASRLDCNAILSMF
jgi:hypothetical protein